MTTSTEQKYPVLNRYWRQEHLARMEQEAAEPVIEKVELVDGQVEVTVRKGTAEPVILQIDTEYLLYVCGFEYKQGVMA